MSQPVHNEHLQVLTKAAFKPSPKAQEMIKRTCASSQSSQRSKVSFRGPLPVNRARSS